jgi:hypothetical protein
MRCLRRKEDDVNGDGHVDHLGQLGIGISHQPLEVTYRIWNLGHIPRIRRDPSIPGQCHGRRVPLFAQPFLVTGG